MQHDRFAYRDYQAFATTGITTVRDGMRWHLIERQPGRYDWSSLEPMLEAAARVGMTDVIELLERHDTGAAQYPRPRAFGRLACATAASLPAE